MPDVTRISVTDWRNRIACSNTAAMQKPHKYPPFEADFLRDCCVFNPPTCKPDCFCRRMGCSGVWSLRQDLEFEPFLDSYANLWARGVSTLKLALRDPKRQAGGRFRNMVPVLMAVKDRWSVWDDQGRSLPQTVGDIKRCYFCDDVFDLIRPITDRIRGLAHDTTGVSTAKVISQLFYDVAVPFDTKSKASQKISGYDPLALGGGAMWEDTRTWLQHRRMSIDDFRCLDDAPLKYWPVTRVPRPPSLTACSRVLDKLFYG